jgi:hypothetical protein
LRLFEINNEIINGIKKHFEDHKAELLAALGPDFEVNHFGFYDDEKYRIGAFSYEEKSKNIDLDYVVTHVEDDYFFVRLTERYTDGSFSDIDVTEDIIIHR